MAKTIKELSEICGVSEQAIRGWCRKNQVAKLAKGKGFAINESTEMAILRHYGAINAKDTKANESNSESTNETFVMLQILQKELDHCRLQLDEKDRQLKEKDKQIERLQQELENAQKQTDQAQQLHALTEQKLQLIEKNEVAATEDSFGKRHWWNRKK